MEEEWIIRVEGREYGPADVDTLREWKDEGRLLPENPARRADLDQWTTAGEIPGLFLSPPPLPSDPEPYRRRSFGSIFRETFRIYRKGFFAFFCFSLIPAIPAFFLEQAVPTLDIGNQTAASLAAVRLSSSSIAMLALFALSWPIFLAGIQLTAADAKAGEVRLGRAFGGALRLWPRFAGLSLLVYGSYFLWSAIPLAAIVGLALGGPSITSAVLVLLFGTFLVYMTARLWVNFLFWQQSAALGDLSGLAALRDSKALARSRQSVPWPERPLYRGAIIVSIWIVVAFVISALVQTPFVFAQLQGVSSLEEMQTALQKLSTAPTPGRLILAAYVTSAIIHAAIRPLVGIAFVVLYFDAKQDREE